ncbi:hypothetical protein GCM10011369_33370 [Neiella marina]|uniref:Uncharacterized protein n=1 Tax=Neiella marina TaxID=508461 RepID=A0A8J2U9Y6_9GAMM|nr:hypothetical protein GCM10011369_33370 [Neiella marina]
MTLTNLVTGTIGLPSKPCSRHSEKTREPVYERHHHAAYGNASKVVNLIQMTNNGGIDQTKEWYSEIGKNHRHRNLADPTMHLNVPQ